MLGVLRDVDADGGAGSGAAAARPAPPPPAWPASATSSTTPPPPGLTVRVEEDGAPAPLSADVDLSAYRIIQEALTNTARHSGGTPRRLFRLGYADHGLEVEVDDDGRPAARSGLPTVGRRLRQRRRRHDRARQRPRRHAQRGPPPRRRLPGPRLAPLPRGLRRPWRPRGPSVIHIAALADDQELVPGRLRRPARRRGRYRGRRRGRRRRTGRPRRRPPPPRRPAHGHPHAPSQRRVEATRRIAASSGLGDVHIVILTTFELDEYVFEGLRAGAYGFLVKDTDAAELIRAVRVVAAGEALLSPTVTPPAHRRVRHRPAARPAPCPASASSPRANARSSRSSPSACPTRRSPARSSSAPPPSRPTPPGP